MAILTVGFVGLGVMGLPIARNILMGGHAVAGFSRSNAPVQALAKDGATAAATAEQAADGADAVVLMVPGPQEVEAVLFDRDGIVEKLPRGAMVLVMSTIDPNTAQRMAARLQAAGLRMLEAPVARPAQNAVDDTLAPLAAAAHAMLVQAGMRGYADADTSSVLRLYEEAAGVELGETQGG
jgi:3-hydroxyisobutyrate dehydrogenase-like beta-hydroxyacid dehydrogenase